MSQLDSSSISSPRGVLAKKPPTSIYTVLMILATTALFIGCVFLYLELRRY